MEVMPANHDAKLQSWFEKEASFCDRLFQKRLKGSDVNKGKNMMAVDKKWVVRDVLPFFDESSAARVERGEPQRVTVYDVEQKSIHVLHLKKLRAGSFVLTGNWKKDFLIRRNLRKGDDIGLCWVPSIEDGSMFYFTVCERVPRLLKIWHE